MSGMLPPAYDVSQAKRQLKLFKSAAEGECRFCTISAQLPIVTGNALVMQVGGAGQKGNVRSGGSQ